MVASLARAPGGSVPPHRSVPQCVPAVITRPLGGPPEAKVPNRTTPPGFRSAGQFEAEGGAGAGVQGGETPRWASTNPKVEGPNPSPATSGAGAASGMMPHGAVYEAGKVTTSVPIRWDWTTQAFLRRL